MNCSEFHKLIQQRLDGERPADATAAEQHAANCPACRLLATAAERLEEGLRLLRSPAPPEALTERIVTAVLADRRERLRLRFRRIALTAAVAAGLLVAVFLGYRPRPGPAPQQVVQDAGQREKPPAEEVSLNEDVQEAGSALVGLVNRTADQAVEQGRVLFPMPATVPTLPPADAWQAPLEQPVASLRTAQQGVAAGLEPVAQSARRAVNLFWQEIPRL